MSHAREQIRVAIVEQLQANPALGAMVAYGGPYAVQDFPAIRVYTINEETTTRTITRPGLQERVLEVAIEIYVNKTTTSWAANMDALALEVEISMSTLIMPDTVTDTMLTGFTADVTAGDRPAGSARLEYQVSYWTNENDPAGAVPIE